MFADLVRRPRMAGSEEFLAEELLELAGMGSGAGARQDARPVLEALEKASRQIDVRFDAATNCYRTGHGEAD